MTAETTAVTVTQDDADIAQAIYSAVRGYGVKFGSPLEHSASELIARHREAAMLEGARLMQEAVAVSVCETIEINAVDALVQEAARTIAYVVRALDPATVLRNAAGGGV